MGWPHVQFAWKTILPRRERYLLIELALHSNKDGIAWPGNEKLQEKTKYCPSNVSQGLANLTAWGYIETVELAKRYKTTRYRICLDAHGVQLEDPIDDDDVQLEDPIDDDDVQLENDGVQLEDALYKDARASELVNELVKDPENPPISPPEGDERSGAHQFPYEFEYYFQSVYPVQKGMWKAFEIFRRHVLNLPQLKHMREVILWRRARDPAWRPDDKGKTYVPSPARFMRERQYGDPLPQRTRAPAPCQHPPDHLAQAASGAWFCRCRHELSPAEAEAMGLTAEADERAIEALAQIKSDLRMH